MSNLKNLPALSELINDPKTLKVCSHSGGKDSQAMYAFLKKLCPGSDLVVIHAHLGAVEWAGTIEHIENTIEPQHVLSIVANPNKDFLSMVEARGMWPSAKYRQCTSDLKRGPIRKEIRRICNKHGYTRVLDCMGLRAQESCARAKKKVYTRLKSECNSKRDWYQWLPIHDWTTEAVFSFIRSAGQQPHWAYGAGMNRLSCRFCIMASKEDLRTSARLNPGHLADIVALEKKIGHTFITPKKGQPAVFLDEYLEVEVEAGAALVFA